MSHISRFVYGDQNVQVPAHLNFGKYMFDHLRLYKHQIALENADTQEKITYEELVQYAGNVACALKKLGVGLGDTVGLASEKRNEFIPTALGIVFTGATYTPFDITGGRAILRHQLSITKPKYFICSNLFWNKHEDLLKTCDFIKKYITLDEETDNLISARNIISGDVNVESFEPTRVQGQSDVAIILCSSGTTGMPKGVQLTHLNCILTSLPLYFTDPSLKVAFLTGSSWYHNYDTFMTYKMLALGKKIVYLDSKWTVERFLRCVDENKVNLALVFPLLISSCAKVEDLSQFNLDSLKIMYSRAFPLHRRTIEDVKMRFPKLQNVLQGYGMTECGEPTSENWGTKGPKPGSVGMISPGLIIKIVNLQTNEILGPYEHGEIRIIGSNLMKGYIGIDPSTYLDEQGFYKTGDIGYYDGDGYFYIVDRISDIINYAGYKVAPLELESILLAHPKVLDAAVVGKQVPIYGEEPAAFVVNQPGADVTEQELIDYVASEVSPLMQLRGGVRFIDEIPRNPRKKILRHNLREMLNKNINHVPPQEMETILLAHPKVLDAAVVGKEVPIFGEVQAAFVVKQPGADVTEQELMDYVASEVAPYMQLRGGVRFIDKIPRNPREKILRRNLREMLNQNNNL